ncbi:MAG: hypothetical protein AAF288_06360 [Planctomycetota bacterium]
MLPADAKLDDMLEAMRGFLNLLADERSEEACAMLDEPNVHGIVWTPTRIHELLQETFGPNSRFRNAHPEGPRFTTVDGRATKWGVSLMAFNSGDGYSAEHDVPLNGEVSDLTALFEFRYREQGLAMILDDLHVL